jgi:hypothetical protein
LVFNLEPGDCPVRRTRSWIIAIAHCAAAIVSIPIGFAGVVGERPPVRFATDVIPILTKLGCNSGGCHGKATGQNGFKMSLLGFEPESDYRELVQHARGRRLSPASPENSLLLLKATNTLPHGGGRRLTADSEDYRVLQQWIAGGAPPPDENDPVLERIELAPSQTVFAGSSQEGAQEQQLPLQVMALLSDGVSQDVTGRCLFESNRPEIATVSPGGRVQVHSPGVFAVMVRYGGKIATFHGTVPHPATDQEAAEVELKLIALESRLQAEQQPSPIDEFLFNQWKRLGILPSAVAADETFMRRATIDICGTLPTRREVEEFLADDRSDKRARLIDRLLDRPEYASYFALKWADLLQNRGGGYSTSKQRAGTALFGGWIRDSIAANKPYSQFVSEIITASGAQNENPPTVWYRTVRKPADYVESVAQAFLGVRIQCAQCHHHPFERWSQADYYGLAAVFSRVGRKGGFADAEVPTNEIIYLKDKGEVHHPRTGKLIDPRALGGPDFELAAHDDPRHSLARWLTMRDNPFFARTMVNRMWAHFLGRGIIDPIDDARGSNPPSNPQLLGALSGDFIASGYDVKHLIRMVCNSYAYGLESAPNKFNHEDSQTFARFYPRRLVAEVLLDGISQVLEVPTEFPGSPGAFPVGMRAIELPDENVPAHFLDVFGRPPRTSACECERVGAASLAQALELVNSAEIHRKLTEKAGYAAQLATSEKSGEKRDGLHRDQVEDIFLRVFARRPSAGEVDTAVGFLTAEKDRAEGYRSLLWSLLATNEFMFNH